MAQFFFHVTDGRRFHPDQAGVELNGVDAAREHALADARQLLASWMARSLTPWRIEVVDEFGLPILSLAVSEAAVSEGLPLYAEDLAPESDSLAHVL